MTLFFFPLLFLALATQFSICPESHPFFPKSVSDTPWKINGWNLQITDLEKNMI